MTFPLLRMMHAKKKIVDLWYLVDVIKWRKKMNGNLHL